LLFPRRGRELMFFFFFALPKGVDRSLCSINSLRRCHVLSCNPPSLGTSTHRADQHYCGVPLATDFRERCTLEHFRPGDDLAPTFITNNGPLTIRHRTKRCLDQLCEHLRSKPPKMLGAFVAWTWVFGFIEPGCRYHSPQRYEPHRPRPQRKLQETGGPPPS
jgi:hypothetical protein